MFKNWKERREYSRLPLRVYGLLLIAILLFFSAAQWKVSPSHLINIIRQNAPLGIVAIAQTIVLLMGGIDLSVGAVISLTNILSTAIMAGNPDNILPGVAISLGIALLIGFINGITIARFKMPPFLITMAMATMIQGGYYVYTRGIPHGSMPASFRVISEGWLGPIPIAALLWLGIWGILSLILYKTPYGKHIYFTGANPKTAWLSGIPTTTVTVSAYMLCSFLAGVAGLILTAFIGVPSTGVGDSYTLNSIAASVIGGTSFAGGVGTLEGTFPGVLIMVLLQSTLTILNIPEAGKSISQGVVIAVMVAINMRVAKPGRRKKA